MRTTGSTMGTLGTETSRQEEGDSVQAEAIYSNGEAEEDVLHKVFGQHLEVSRLRLRQVKNPSWRRLWMFRTLCDGAWTKLKTCFFFNARFVMLSSSKG